METIAMTGITIAGQTIFGRVIYDTYDLVKDTTSHPVVNSILGEIDLQADLSVVEALVNQVNSQIKTEQLSQNDPLTISLHQVNDLVHRIRDELEEIKKELRDHQQKWLASWRTPDYQRPLNRLVHHKKLLDKRVQMLIELIKLHQS